jgi:hypothetical protein
MSPVSLLCSMVINYLAYYQTGIRVETKVSRSAN